MGQKLPSRPKFVWNDDGTIKGVEDAPLLHNYGQDDDVASPKKFGKMSQSLLSGRSPGMSMSMVSNVAFSDINYV